MRLGCVLGAPLVAAASAFASPETLPIDLGWEGPASCPASDDLQRDVRRFLGETTLATTPAPIAARVSVRESTEGRLEVRMVTTSGGVMRERALSTDTCAEARDVVAFLLALLIDPSAREPAPSPSPRESEVAHAPSPPLPERKPSPRRSPANEHRARFSAALSVSAELGMLPGGSVGGELRAGLLQGAWSLEGRGGAWLPRDAESPDVPGASGRFTLLEAALLGCLRGGPGRGPSIQVCTGPAVLFLRGEGYGVRAPGRDDALLAALSAEGALLIALSPRVSLRPCLGALLPFRRPTFSIHDVGPIHRPAAVSARAVLGLEARY